MFVAGTGIHWVVALPLRALGMNIPPNAASTYLLTHPSWIAMGIVLTAPVIEELAFRAFLATRAAPVFVGLAFFLAYLGLTIFGVLAPHPPPALVVTHYFMIVWWLLGGGILSLTLWVFARRQILTIFERHGRIVFWGSCLMFGLGHVLGYARPSVLALFLVLPQFALGLILAYIRISHGLRWSIATHLVFDSIAVFLTWLAVSPGYSGHTTFALHAGLIGLLLIVTVIGLWNLLCVARLRV